MKLLKILRQNLKINFFNIFVKYDLSQDSEPLVLLKIAKSNCG